MRTKVNFTNACNAKKVVLPEPSCLDPMNIRTLPSSNNAQTMMSEGMTTSFTVLPGPKSTGSECGENRGARSPATSVHNQAIR